ncbi:MAG: DUF3780 domain-containing protein [Alphaproteobacteria bacterium]|nr:MAG: DUF3780 domain-containing protein [Alphaproteobacteria bacterium]
MSKRAEKTATETLRGAFGFDPDEATAYFLVHVPRSNAQPVEVSEHLSWNPERITLAAHYGERDDGQVRCRLARPKWNEIADVVRAEFNARLKREGRRPGRWKAGFNPVTRLLGKELTVLMWAIEDADPATIPIAIANWQGLTPEERWWLYTMTAAATGNAITDRGRGWRKALRFALTENPVTGRHVEQPVVPEFFRLVSETPAISGEDAPMPDQPTGVDSDDDRPSTIKRETDTAEILKPARKTTKKSTKATGKKTTRRKKST